MAEGQLQQASSPGGPVEPARELLGEGVRAPFKRGVLAENPILCQVLGVCSALAVTNRMDTTLVMCSALLAVTPLSCLVVSLLRNWTPHRVRMMTQMLVIATPVIVIDQYLKAFHFGLSKALGPYIGLIITNCILMGRCEAYASKNPPLPAAADGLGNALGYSLVLCAIAIVRETLGSGTLLGLRVMPEAYRPCQLMALAPGAFVAMGCLAWIVSALGKGGQAAQK